MMYTKTSLAIVEYKLDEMKSFRNYCDIRIRELVEIREKILEEIIREYEKVE